MLFRTGKKTIVFGAKVHTRAMIPYVALVTGDTLIRPGHFALTHTTRVMEAVRGPGFGWMSPADASNRNKKTVDFTGLEWARADGGFLSFLGVFMNAKTLGQ